MDARKMSQAKRLKFARRSKTLDFGSSNDLLKKIEKEVDKDRKKNKLNQRPMDDVSRISYDHLYKSIMKSQNPIL